MAPWTPALLAVAVMLAIIATGLVVPLYERARGGREAIYLASSPGELNRLDQRRLAPEGMAAPSLRNR